MSFLMSVEHNFKRKVFVEIVQTKNTEYWPLETMTIKCFQDVHTHIRFLCDVKLISSKTDLYLLEMYVEKWIE